jgi:uncharacterized protein YkwD
MKKLLISLVVILISLISLSQTQSNIPDSVTLDISLSKDIFNQVNLYRQTLNVKPYAWSDSMYQIATNYNLVLANNGLWEHSNSIKIQELLTAVPIISNNDFTSKFISDYAINAWITSKSLHGHVLKLQIAQKLGETGTIYNYNGINIDGVQLVNTGALSAVVLHYHNYKVIYIVLQLK